MKEPPSLNFQETALSPELFCGMILREKTPRSLLSEIVAIYSGEVKWCSNRPFYRYGGHIEFIRFKEYYGMPRGHWLSIYARFSGKKRISTYISREKGDRHYIQTRHNDLFSHYNLFLGKLKEKLARKARVNTERVYRIVLMPPGHPIILLKSN